MINKTKQIIMKLVMVVLIIAFIFSIAMVIEDLTRTMKIEQTTNYSEEEVPFSNITSYEECADLSLDETAECLNSYVRTFYIYNMSNKGKVLMIDRLKREGGVCHHWRDLYKLYFRNLGYELEQLEEIHMAYGDKLHTYLRVVSEEGYCILDQKFYECFMFKGKEDEDD